MTKLRIQFVKTPIFLVVTAGSIAACGGGSGGGGDSSLEGFWKGNCTSNGNNDSYQATLSYDGSIGENVQSIWLSSATCSGIPDQQTVSSFDYIIGGRITTDSGVEAREIDIQGREIEEAVYSIFAIQGGNTLYLADHSTNAGDEPSSRPTDLRFDNPYFRQTSPNAGDSSDDENLDSTDGSGQMTACFNPDLISVGSNVSLRYRDELIDNEYTNRYEVLGSGSFNGYDGLRLDVVSSGIESTRYLQQDASIPQTAQIGETFESGDAAGRSIGYEPPATFRYNLNVGEDYDQSYVFINGPSRAAVEVNTRFVGIETITVSAGTFQACRVQQTSQIDGQTNNRTLWLATGSGVLLRDILNGSEAQLLSGTVNGESVR